MKQPLAFQVRVLWFFVLMSKACEGTNEVRIDGGKGLRRGCSKNRIAYANFVAHKLHYLNITPAGSGLVRAPREFGQACVESVSCYSFNLAAFIGVDGRISCELLPSDKYNKSDKFTASPIFHHFSIRTPCSSAPCINSGTCHADYEAGVYSCTCSPGYSGKQCQIDIDECVSNPCLNGATCVDHVNGYSCSCTAGYTGHHCETDIDECSSSPCLNDGTCIDRVNGFECTCIANVMGSLCEIIDVQDPVALYPLNTAHTTRDIMGNQGDGVPSNVLTAVGPDGNAGGSYQFRGMSNSFVELPNNGGLDTQYSLTVLMWVYPEGSPGYIFLYRPSGTWGPHLFITESNVLLARFPGRNSEWPDALFSPEPLTLREWVYVGVAYDYHSGIARMWVDGGEVEQLHHGTFTLRTQYAVRIGVRNGESRYFKGRVARVQVYDIALNRDQVVAVKNRGSN